KQHGQRQAGAKQARDTKPQNISAVYAVTVGRSPVHESVLVAVGEAALLRLLGGEAALLRRVRGRSKAASPTEAAAVLQWLKRNSTVFSMLHARSSRASRRVPVLLLRYAKAIALSDCAG